MTPTTNTRPFITSYVVNPNLKYKVVTTKSNKTEYLRNCRLINGEYYICNEECFSVNGKDWLPSSIFHKHYAMDDRTGKYTEKSYLSMYIKSINFEECTINTGWTSLIKTTPIKTINFYFQGNYYNLLEKDYPIIDLLSNKYLKVVPNQRNLTFTFYNEKVTSSKDRFEFPNQGYNIEQCGNFDIVNSTFKNTNLPIENSTKSISNLLGNYTFGLENETVKGIIPDELLRMLGIVICKDGSIGYSPEYTSVIYSGAKGLQAMKETYRWLAQLTTCNESCSFHIHFGNLPNTKEFALALYKLFCEIQHDLFLMLPFYKRDYQGVKKQNYNQFLDNIIAKYQVGSSVTYRDYINTEFHKFAVYLNNGNDLNVSNGSTIPELELSGGNQQNKWNLTRRYYALNFMNLLFSPRKTVEFRAHQATSSFTKASNWFFICLAILKYAETNSKEILTGYNNYSLKKILKIYKTQQREDVSEYLHAYYKSRKKLHEAAYTVDGDKISKFEFKEDLTYTFSTENIKNSLY